MANIALDIKANTTKALGEFKKLSRELDNKFLVQGLKLDVVKNAFRQINREFEQSLGSQGIAASESTGQIQRNAAAQLALYSRLGIDASLALTRETKKQLGELVAQGELTKSVMQEALTIQGSIKFDGDDFGERSRALTVEIAKLGQNFNDILGNNKGLETLNQLVTGDLRIDDLQNIDLGANGAAANLIKETIRSISGGRFDSMSVVERSKVLEEAMRALGDSGNRFGKLMDALEEDAQSTVAFKQAIRQFTGIFSEDGLLGPLNDLGKEMKNFENVDVSRNVLQLSAKLISTLFDQDRGLFAVLFRTMGDVFGFDPENIIEPILRGTELLIGVFESLTEFVQSPAFRNFLEIFKPFIDAIKGIEMPERITAEDINNGVSKIFGGIRGLLSNLNTYISNVDTKVIEDIVGNFLGQLINTLPGILEVVFTTIGKAIDSLIGLLNSDGIKGAEIGNVLAAVGNGVADLVGKIFVLIASSLPKIIGATVSGITKLDTGGTVLVGAVIANGIARLFTGQGLLGTIKERVSSMLGISRGGRSATGINATSARGSEQQRWSRLYTYLENILRALNGEAPLGPGDGADRDRRDRRRRGTQEQRQRDRRARELRSQRRRRDATSRARSRFSRGSSRFRRFAGRLPGIRQFRGAQLASSFLRGPRNLPGISNLAQGTPQRGVSALGTDYRPLTTRSGLRVPGASPAALFDGNFQRAPFVPRPVPRLAPAVPTVPRGPGFGGNIVNRALIGTRSPDVAARFAGRFGARGILSRVGGRLGGGAVGGLLTALTLGSIFSGGAAQASEIEKNENLTAEEKEYYRAENQKRTREQAGRAVIGAAGGVLGGAIGTAIGGPAGTIIGGILGDLAGNIVADILPAPITEGVGKLAEDIGGWFTGAWENIKGGWTTATGAIGNFFGKEGPIQRFGRFAGDNVKGGVENIQNFFGEEGPIQRAGKWFSELGGKIMTKLEESWNGLLDLLTSLPGKILIGALGPLGFLLNDALEKRKKEQQEEPTPNFAGGFNILGGRTSFNEYEAIGMPDGVTYIPLTSSTSLDSFMGDSPRGSTTNNLEVTVNVTGDDPKAIATEVIAEIDRIYRSVNV